MNTHFSHIIFTRPNEGVFPLNYIHSHSKLNIYTNTLNVGSFYFRPYKVVHCFCWCLYANEFATGVVVAHSETLH